MPYVNCPECGIRSFALAPWSAVNRCPTCEAPLRVPRQSALEDRPQRRYGRERTSLATPEDGQNQLHGTR